jgi:N-acyl-D-amino-acid deacylase
MPHPAAEICDLLIRDGLVLDGTGAPGRWADVAVRGERVVAVGDLAAWRGHEVMAASGLAVAPGFIDVHTHDDRAVLDDPALAPKVSQGVTSVIVGLCGLSLAPRPTLALEPWPSPFSLLGAGTAYSFPSMAAYMVRLRAAPPSVNVGVLVGHANLRACTMADLARPATADEVARMRPLAEEAFAAGALGLSSGLAYDAGRHATTDEVTALAAVAGTHGGLYVTHLRDEGDRVVEAVAEALAIGREAGCGVVISHHKCLFRPNWGRTVETLAAIDAARAHQSVALDVYPYTASSTVLSPDKAARADRVIVAWSDTLPEAAGRDLDALADEWSCGREAAAERLMPGGAVYFNMDEADLRRVMRHPCCAIGSDGVPSHPHPHPRLWGTFPRVLGRYVREERVLGLEEAVHKMTGLPATQFGLADRGTIRPGAFADLAIFDPATIADVATFEAPLRPATGIRRVLVNGATVFAEGRAIHRPAGHVLARAGRDQAKGGSSHAA